MRTELAGRRAEFDRLAEATSRLTADAASRDQLVSVQINARGLLRSLRIEPAALRRYRADQLAAEILALVQAADEKIAAVRNRMIAATVQEGNDYSQQPGGQSQ
ncbi:YbaB/EbfC family nucleoid-associated protein [Gordonia sp. TBRC 11910]|uniref:YbaB/EbfC family nucleoid-associated protein n=1 Tax=Gordonia asplenii TaxID=2725283 RepID=A0A848KKV5_9ACTN|nr:YbaB/EbfC family nucleoid-associated protein [Gordonia asplenii]